jgi:hypothetical protein
MAVERVDRQRGFVAQRPRVAQDDERAEEALADSLGGVLVRVVPERAVLVRAEAVDEAAARRD